MRTGFVVLPKLEYCILITLTPLLATVANAAAPTNPEVSLAPENPSYLSFSVRVGYSLGATTPMGIPATIRKLNSYRLPPNVVLGVDAIIPLTLQRSEALPTTERQSRWGLLTGLHFEHKGMDATVTTKGYHMAMVKGGEELEGVYTGRVEQHVKAWMFTVPLQVTYSLGARTSPSSTHAGGTTALPKRMSAPRWQLRFGPYLSLLTSKAFNGNVSDGYLRKDTPTGQKIEMGHEDDERATYDFSSDMRRLQFGLDFGAHWQMARQFGLGADLSWGLTGLMHSSFKTVEQTLYPIYGTISVTYQLQ